MVSGGYRHAIDGGTRIKVDGRWMACVQFTNEEEVERFQGPQGVEWLGAMASSFKPSTPTI